MGEQQKDPAPANPQAQEAQPAAGERGKEAQQQGPDPAEQPLAEPTPSLDPEVSGGATAEKAPETVKQETSRDVEEVITSSADKELGKARLEAKGSAIKTLEEKLGKSLGFSSEQYDSIKKHIEDRFAMVFAHKAEAFLRNPRNKTLLQERGIDPQAQGAQAIQAVEMLGELNRIIDLERNDELTKVFFAREALKVFSQTEIPPSARFAVVEQLNQIYQLDPKNEEVQKLMLESFEKWSGREPSNWNERAIQARVNVIIAKEILPAKLKEQADSISEPYKTLADQKGLSHEDGMCLKDSGYRYVPASRWKPWAGEKLLAPDGAQMPINNIGNLVRVLRSSWVAKVEAGLNADTQLQDTLKERAKREIGAVFVHAVANKDRNQLNSIYRNLQADVLGEYDRQAIQGTKEGEKLTDVSQEAVEGEGKSYKEFTRNMPSGMDEESLRAYLNDYGVEVSGGFEDFDKRTGMNYANVSKKRRGMLFYVLRLVNSTLQETRKAIGSL